MLSEKPPRGLRWKFDHHPLETHNSVVHRSLYDGLEFIFDGWRLEDPVAAYDAGGLEALASSAARARARFGYSTELSTSNVLSVVAGMIGESRLEDALALAEGLDPKSHAVPPALWGFLGEQLEKAGNMEGVKTCHLRCLKVDPFNKGSRAALAKMGVEAPPLPEPVKVPEATLQSYVGTYRASDLGEASVTVDKGQLQLQIMGSRRPRPLHAAARTRFYLPGLGILVFDRKTSPAASFTVDAGARKFVFARVAEKDK